MVRLNLYNHNNHCGTKYVRQELEHQDIKPLPSINAISRVLRETGLTHRRTGLYDEG